MPSRCSSFWNVFKVQLILRERVTNYWSKRIRENLWGHLLGFYLYIGYDPPDKTFDEPAQFFPHASGPLWCTHMNVHSRVCVPCVCRRHINTHRLCRHNLWVYTLIAHTLIRVHAHMSEHTTCTHTSAHTVCTHMNVLSTVCTFIWVFSLHCACTHTSVLCVDTKTEHICVFSVDTTMDTTSSIHRE